MKGISSPTSQLEVLRNVKPKQKKKKGKKKKKNLTPIQRKQKRGYDRESTAYIAPSSKTDELLKHSVEPTKPDRKEHVKLDSIYTVPQSRQCEPGAQRAHLEGEAIKKSAQRLPCESGQWFPPGGWGGAVWDLDEPRGDFRGLAALKFLPLVVISQRFTL